MKPATPSELVGLIAVEHAAATAAAVGVERAARLASKAQDYAEALSEFAIGPEDQDGPAQQHAAAR
jgi:hypothetical protein